MGAVSAQLSLPSSRQPPMTRIGDTRSPSLWGGSPLLSWPRWTLSNEQLLFIIYLRITRCHLQLYLTLHWSIMTEFPILIALYCISGKMLLNINITRQLWCYKYQNITYIRTFLQRLYQFPQTAEILILLVLYIPPILISVFIHLAYFSRDRSRLGCICHKSSKEEKESWDCWWVFLQAGCLLVTQPTVWTLHMEIYNSNEKSAQRDANTARWL